MIDLLIKPSGVRGKVHDITPASAGWRYVGFGVYRLAAGDQVAESTGEREALLVLVEGKATFSAGGRTLGELGERRSVFDGGPPYSVYLPEGSDWRAQATTECTLAVCHAPAKGGSHPLRVIAPDEVQRVQRGKGANARTIHPILMEDRDWAGRLLVTEVYTPQGHWSSYPPHRHDNDAPPDITYLEETYYHRINPRQGFGVQRVYTEDGSLDQTMAFGDGDVVLVPRGHHPVGAPYGYAVYYLNVMAGPVRQWRFKNHPDHDWIYQKDLP